MAVSTFQGVMETQRGHDFATFSVRQVDRRVHLLQSEIAPITTIMMNLAMQEKATQTKVEWSERSLLPHTTKINGAVGDTTTTTVNVDDPAYVKPGDYLYDQTTGERMGPVLTVNTSSGDVTLGKRGLVSTPHNIADEDIIIIMRGNIPEGGAAAEALTSLATMQYNYIEPTSTTFKVSDILEDSEQYADVDKIAELHALKMKDHMEDLEKKLIDGIRGLETTLNSQTLYFMGGFFYYVQSVIETVNVGVGGTKAFTQKQWESYIRRLFTYNQASARKTVVASGDVLEQISDFKYQALLLRPDDPMIDVSTFSYRSQFGTVDLVHHRFFTSEFGKDWYALGIDLNKVKWMVYQPQIHKANIQERRFHRREDEIYVSASLEVINEATHGIFRVIASA